MAPEAVGKIKLAVVCLEHGKPDPAAHIPYEIRPVESFSKDPQVKELLTMLGQGNLDQRAAQAAAWHFANGLSWDELATKKIHHLGGRPDEPYFLRSGFSRRSGSGRKSCSWQRIYRLPTIRGATRSQTRIRCRVQPRLNPPARNNSR